VSTLTKAGRYDLREELGRGAMGVVYHGFDPVIGRDVAVKTMHLTEAGTGMSHEELIGRFQTEARAAGLLTHPNIVVVYDAGEENGLFYITMEFVEGRSLQSLIDSHQPFPLPRVMKLMEQVCSALDFAHQHNVVHRDIKPANLMLTPDDTVKITDFGTAKILQFGTSQTAHVMGTPSYMSPEQVKGKPVDGRSDIFSLGVILYELMTGEKPFPGQNITTVIYKIINEEPVPPRSLDSSIHPGLSAVITKALAKEPAARFQSCHEFLTALKTFHEKAANDATVRIAPVVPQPPATVAINRPPAPTGSAATPLVPRTFTNDPPGRLSLRVAPLPVLMETEEPKRGGRLLLTLVLLGIIGYSGYRVYPPLVDLWQRAKEPVVATVFPAHHAAAPAATNAEGTDAKPEAAPDNAPQNSQNSTATAGSNSANEDNTAPQDATQPTAAPAVAVKPPEPAALPVKSAEKPVAQPKPITTPAAPPPAQPKPVSPPAASAAQLFASKLASELAGQPLATKLKMQATGNSLTLSGTLTLAEQRELLRRLRAVPPGVRVIDDIEYADPQSQNGSAASDTAGWVWVRSDPRGARVLVDGVETGLRTPVRVELNEGEHEILLILRGYVSDHRTVTVHPRQTMQITDSLGVE
jgi:serine/threonine protein kinase